MKSVVSRTVSVIIAICVIGMTLIMGLSSVVAGKFLSYESSEKIYNSVLAESLRINNLNRLQ